MSSRRNIIITVGAAVSVSLIASALAVMLVLSREGRRQFELLNTICAETAEQEPETRETIAAVLKEYTRKQQGGLSYETAQDNSSGQADREQEDILAALGYGVSDFAGPAGCVLCLCGSFGRDAAVVSYLSISESKRVFADSGPD